MTNTQIAAELQTIADQLQDHSFQNIAHERAAARRAQYLLSLLKSSATKER